MEASRARSLMAAGSRGDDEKHGRIYHVFKWRMAGNLFLFINEKQTRHFEILCPVVVVN